MTMEDHVKHDVSQLKEDIGEIKSDLKLIASTLNKIAVQEEKLAQQSKELDYLKQKLCANEDHINELYKIHGRCSCASGAMADNIIEIETKIEGVKSKFSELKQSHDRCSIEAVKTDLGWVKWFVMGNTASNVAMIFGTIFRALKGP